MIRCLIKPDLIKALKVPKGPFHAKSELGDVGYHVEAGIMLNAIGWSGA